MSLLERAVEQLKEHWLRVLLVTVGLLVAEQVDCLLRVCLDPIAPERSSRRTAALILAVLGYFAAVELIGVYEEGRRWLSTARAANGRPEAIAEASRAFVRMVCTSCWRSLPSPSCVHESAASARAAAGRTGAGSGGTAGGGGTGAGQGGDVIPISRHPAYQPRFQTPGSPPSGPTGSAFGPAGRRRDLAPDPRRNARPGAGEAADPGSSADRSYGAEMHVRPRRSARACGRRSGSPSATDRNPSPRPPFVLELPVETQPQLATYRRWIGHASARPVLPPARAPTSWSAGTRRTGSAAATASLRPCTTAGTHSV